MKSRLFAAFLLPLALTAGCKKSGASPSAPTSTSSFDLTGTWDESTGGDLTWTLTQSAGTVTGSTRFSQSAGQFLGAVSGQGTITGTVSGSTFTFTDTYTTLSRPNCSLTATGSLTIASSTRMTGRYTDSESCNGVVLGSTNGNIDMRKR